MMTSISSDPELPLQRPLFFSKLHDLLIHGHAFALPDRVHVRFCDVDTVCLLAQILQFFLSSGDPEWVLVE